MSTVIKNVLGTKVSTDKMNEISTSYETDKLQSGILFAVQCSLAIECNPISKGDDDKPHTITLW